MIPRPVKKRGTRMLEKDELKPIIEAIIFAADTALSVDRIAGILEGEDRSAIKAAIAELVEEYDNGPRGFSLEEVAGGWRFRTKPDYAPWLRRLFKIGLQRISKASMEALAIIAYRQPVTRGEIETIRGVDSGGVLGTLMDKRFIKITGRKEVPGRPVVYGTTKEFLETFDLKDLSCLPSLKDIQKMEEENAAENPLPEEQGAANDTEARLDGPNETDGGDTPGGETGEEGGGHGREDYAAQGNGGVEDDPYGAQARGRETGDEGGCGAEEAVTEEVIAEEAGGEEAPCPEDRAGEDTEDNSAGGDNVEEEG